MQTFTGLPFVDPSFNYKRALAGVMVIRTEQARRAGIVVSNDDVYDPGIATLIRQQQVCSSVPSKQPTDAHVKMIDLALHHLRSAIPWVAPLTNIPLKFRILEQSQAISASSFAWPQHIFLGEDAFESVELLTEQVTHELCHCWLYFLEEINAIQTLSLKSFSLPSGTSGRDAAEVIGALHVATALQILWSSLDVHADARTQRLRDLHSYALGCVSTLQGPARGHLTVGGVGIAESLAGRQDEFVQGAVA